jgi:uncharacterized membrane protein
MRTDLQESSARPPVLRRAVAGLVLIAAVALALKLVIGLVLTVFYVVVVAAVVLAVLWALKTLVW